VILKTNIFKRDFFDVIAFI